MRKFLIFAVLAASAPLTVGAPAVAQSQQDEARFDAAQQRFDAEVQRYQSEVQRYRDARSRYSAGPQGGRYAPPPGGYNDDRAEGFDPAQRYRSGNYQERTLAADDRVYRGSDGRYYCQRNDGTTGLIIGAAGGGILGNVIDGGHSRTVGTLIGGALGAIAGRSVDQQNSQVRCR